MTSVFTLLWLSDIANGLKDLFGILAILVAGVSGFVAMVRIEDFIDYVAENGFPRAIKQAAFLSASLLVLSVSIPSKNTLYALSVARLVQVAQQSEVGQDATAAVQALLKRMVRELEGGK